MTQPLAPLTSRYQLLAPLGAGSMGAVYRAYDRLSGQDVALKRVTLDSPALDDDSDALRLALAHEFRTLAGLRHPNIISVLDYGFDAERQPFFTMELLEFISVKPLAPTDKGEHGSYVMNTPVRSPDHGHVFEEANGVLDNPAALDTAIDVFNPHPARR